MAKKSKSWAETSPSVWPVRILICAGCGRIVENDNRVIVEGVHRRRLYGSGGNLAVDDLCGEVAAYDFAAIKSPNPTSKAPVTA